MKNLIFVCLLIVVMYVSCKKEKDTITQHDIKGMVFNNCTDSGLANVTVYLQDGQGLNLSTVSGVNGNFSFNNVQIHSSTKYNYALYILSKSGINAQTFEYCGFGGTVLGFNYNEVDMFFKPRVTPKFLYYNIITKKIIPTNHDDSVKFSCKNYTFHKNDRDPQGYTPYGWGGGWGNIPGGNGEAAFYNGIGNYPMGKYIIDIDIWKAGVHTTSKDSIYLGWGAIRQDTLYW